MSPPTGQIVSSVKLSGAPAWTITGRSQSQDCFRSLDTYVLYIDTVLAMSLMFSLLKIIKEIYEMSLKPFVLF